jgi:hypothetical protein
VGEPLRVDPAALSGAGSAVAGLSEALTAAVSALTGSYNADTGQDAAGTAFGFAYQDSARALVDGVGKGVNALRHIGYLIQGSATNYSRAEAAADIRGGASPLPAPVAPAQYSAPGGDPDVNGPGQTPPVLWYLVEFLVGDWWPNGSPGELRAAAAAWSVIATPLYGVASGDSGAYATIDAQQMPDKEPMKTAVRDVGTAMSSLAGEAQKLAGELTGFATDVETTQNAIRDLLNKLKSVVGSVVDQGVLGTVFELITGDAEEKIHEVADDIKAVMANHKRQSAARKELLGQLNTSIRNYARAMEIITRVELVNYLGEDAGRIVAGVSNALTDASVGIGLSGINLVGGIATLDPIGDPKGTWDMIEGLGKVAEVLNPMTAPIAFATDPQGSLDMLKEVTHYDDITSDRPFLGIGELGFDIGTAIIPGGAGVKAAGGARAAEGAAARAEISATERAAGEASGIASATGGLRNVSRDLEGVTAKLDDLNKTGLDGGKPPSGSPGPLPKPGEPGPPPGPLGEPGGPPRPGDPLPPPRPGDPTPTPGHGAVGPTERVPGDVPGHPGSGSADVPKIPGEPKPSIVDVPPTPAERQAMATQYEEGQVARAGVTPSGAGEGSALPSVPSAGSMEGAGAHGGEASSSAAGGASDRVPVSVGAHGAEGAADGAGHGPHSGGGGGASHGGGDSHGGAGDHGGGGHGTGGEHGDSPDRGSHDGDASSDSHADPSGLTPEKRDEILAMEKGDRPDPSEYLSREFIEEHLGHFRDGAAKFMSDYGFAQYGIGQIDGTSFVLSKHEADELMRSTQGNPRAMERSLGLPPGFLEEHNVLRIDVPDPQSYNLRVPSGNEAGANSDWIPGGYLPDGLREAVIDGAAVPPDRYTVTEITNPEE